MKVIPEAALAQHIAILGKTGSGKTTAAKSAIVEPLLEANRRVAIVDPTSAWWGLRSSSDGKGPGFPILVLGGDHGDLPLPALGGEAVARLVVEQSVNVVADTGNLTMGERTRWFIDFAGTLYRLNRAPLHLVLDEAHNFAPQGRVPDPDTGKMLHAANQLASGGRSRGIRLVMITQRPQKLHKDALTSADTLIAMRVLAPQDRLAVEEWIKGCGDIAQGKEVLNSLAGMPRGEGWVWYPEGSYLKRTKFPAVRTFDSSATPTDTHPVETPKNMAEIDLTEIKAALADAVEEAEENDPRLLKKRIRELELRQTEVLEQAHAVATVTPEQLDRAVADARTQGKLDGYQAACTDMARSLADMDDALVNMEHALSAVRSNSAKLKGWARRTVAVPIEEPPARANPIVAAYDLGKTPARTIVSDQNGALPEGERKILTACAQHRNGCTRQQLTVLTGYKRSTRDAYIQRLREKQFLAVNGERINATPAGVAALGPNFKPLPVGHELRTYWLSKLPEGERRVLQVVVNSHPTWVQRERISEATGYKRSSRDAYIQRLAARELVVATVRGVVASDMLFPRGQS